MPSIAKTIKGILFGKGMQKAKFIGGPMKGMVAYFDFVRDTQTWRGIYEVAQMEWLIRAINPGAVCVDIGAAEGYFTLLMAREAGRNGHVIAFEPSERRDYMQRAYDLNAPLGLAELTIVTEFAVGPNTVDFNGITFDTYAEQTGLSRLDVVKIDVDGGEMDVLEGMRGTLERFHPHISVELHSPELHERVATFLAELGYEMTLVDPPAYEYRPIPFNKFFFSEI